MFFFDPVIRFQSPSFADLAVSSVSFFSGSFGAAVPISDGAGAPFVSDGESTMGASAGDLADPNFNPDVPAVVKTSDSHFPPVFNVCLFIYRRTYNNSDAILLCFPEIKNEGWDSNNHIPFSDSSSVVSLKVRKLQTDLLSFLRQQHGLAGTSLRTFLSRLGHLRLEPW
jgi:hypothetical protein